jgi:hypothetical protein
MAGQQGPGVTPGSDSNDGLTSATPWLTFQHAWETVKNGYEMNGHSIKFKLGWGTYHTGLTARGMPPGHEGAGSVIIEGDVSAPQNFVIAPDSGCGNGIAVSEGAMLTIRGLSFNSQTGVQDQISIGQHGILQIDGPVDFQQAGQSGSGMNHISVAGAGAMLVVKSGYQISGGAQCHISAGFGATVYYNTNGDPNYALGCTVINTPHFDAGFMAADAAFINCQATSFSGSATGPKFLVKNNGLIDTYGAGVNVFPGNVAGTTSNGGIYA